MEADLVLISAFMFYSAFGAVTRALFGIYKAYTTIVMFRIDLKRVAIEIVASIFFGTFSSILLQEIGGFKVGMNVAALIAGFFGADLIDLISKKIGLTKSLEVKVTEQQIAQAGLNERQIAALGYLKTHKTITNEIYQKINQTNHDTAKRDLAQLVKLGKIRKVGTGKKTRYEIIQ
jgi:hypothetical protein